MREIVQITGVGLAAVLWIVVVKLIVAKYPIPGVSQVMAMV